MRYMTVVLINGSNARVVFRGSREQCVRVADDYVRESFVLPTRF